MVRVPYVLGRPVLGDDEDRKLVQLRRNGRETLAAGEARVGDRLLREIAELGADHHHAERPRDVRARTGQDALDVLLLLRRQRVVVVRRRDAVAAQTRHSLAQLRRRGRLFTLCAAAPARAIATPPSVHETGHAIRDWTRIRSSSSLTAIETTEALIPRSVITSSRVSLLIAILSSSATSSGNSSAPVRLRWPSAGRPRDRRRRGRRGCRAHSAASSARRFCTISCALCPSNRAMNALPTSGGDTASPCSESR